MGRKDGQFPARDGEAASVLLAQYTLHNICLKVDSTSL
jgi:hypothetical protein